LTLNGSAADLNAANPLTYIAAASCSSGGTITLYRNGTAQTLTGGAFTETLSSAVSYNLTAYCAPDANHTSSSLTYNVNAA
jgi:hypothetical protein